MRWQPNPVQLTTLKSALFAAALIPLARLIYGALNDGLGANPIEFVTRATGTWTFNFLLITLAVTPLRRLTDCHWLLRLRRMLGLFTFFYASLHFATFIWFDHFFDLQEIAKDVVKRPFVTVGFSAYLLLLPLAATSNAWAIRHLGGKRWQLLHRSVYAIGVLACIHYFWLVKAIALLYPISYALIFAILMGLRARARIASFGPYPQSTSAAAARALPPH